MVLGLHWRVWEYSTCNSLTTCDIIAAELAIATIYRIGEVDSNMRQTPGSHPHPHSSRPSYLAEVTLALIHIWHTRASGRLSIRNGERFGLAHLYFNEARLVHVAGDKREAEAVLNDLLTWLKGNVRFDPAMTVNYESVNWQQAQIFTRWLAFLEVRGGMHDIPRARLDGLTQSLTAHLPKQPIVLPDVVEHYEEYNKEALARQWQRLGEGVDRVNHLIGRTEEIIKRTFNAEQRQRIIQSAQRTIESVGQTVSEMMETAPLPQISPLTPQPEVRSIRPPSSRRNESNRER